MTASNVVSEAAGAWKWHPPALIGDTGNKLNDECSDRVRKSLLIIFFSPLQAFSKQALQRIC
jgi:hypothetical protein